MDLSWLQATAFLLAAAAVVANDSLQTLGTFLSSNRGRTPLPLQMAFLALLTSAVLGLGWWLNGGDPTWGRLAAFPLPNPFTWVELLPPLVVLLLTRWGVPVSTSVLLLSAIAPANLGPLLLKSLVGYGLGLALALLLYGGLLWLLEGPVLEAAAPARGATAAAQPGPPSGDGPLWLVLQWLSTAWLWSQWLVHDLANIYVLLPRQLGPGPLALTAALLCLGLCALVAWGGGPIQQLVRNKTNSGDLRSATLIDLLFGALLLLLARLSPFPLSTTWVFLGLLAGRELALLLRLRHRPVPVVAGLLGSDLAKAALGLLLSLAVALLIQPLKSL
jgi:phosphate/sulfate permease